MRKIRATAFFYNSGDGNHSRAHPHITSRAHAPVTLEGEMTHVKVSDLASLEVLD